MPSALIAAVSRVSVPYDATVTVWLVVVPDTVLANTREDTPIDAADDRTRFTVAAVAVVFCIRIAAAVPLDTRVSSTTGRVRSRNRLVLRGITKWS